MAGGRAVLRKRKVKEREKKTYSGVGGCVLKTWKGTAGLDRVVGDQASTRQDFRGQHLAFAGSILEEGRPQSDFRGITRLGIFQTPSPALSTCHLLGLISPVSMSRYSHIPFCPSALSPPPQSLPGLQEWWSKSSYPMSLSF